MTNIISPDNSDVPLTTAGPVVFLLLDGWGVAPLSEANAMTSAKTPCLDSLIKEYPVALLLAQHKTINARYLSLGAGQDLVDENLMPTATLSKILASHNLKQIKITETERLAALTHFFNGHEETRAFGEDWKIVSSEAGNHSIKPVLALNRIGRELIKAIESEKYNFLVAAVPTLDLVAASGDFKAVKKVVEMLDSHLRKIVNLVLSKKGVLVISSACGNAEYLKSMATELVDKNITDNPVPLIIVGEEYKGKTIGLREPLNNDLSLLAPAGNLSDVAPTILSIMSLAKPEEMTGVSLFDK